MDNLFHLFIEELRDIYSTERIIVEKLPEVIDAASLPDLKEALAHHLKETKNHIKRLEKIFSILGEPVKEGKCKAVERLFRKMADKAHKNPPSPTLDAALICSEQKVEHYEIASYGTLRSFAKQLELEIEIIHMLNETLDEEAASDKRLTKIAEGSTFSSGVNQAAASK